MIVVDSAVWAAFFNGEESPHTLRLDRGLGSEEDLGVFPLIITEVLQGFRTERGFLTARDLLIALPILVPSVESHVEAARLFRRLREKGVSVRGTVDCVIAQACIDCGAELLSPDADFVRISKHSPLRLCPV